MFWKKYLYGSDWVPTWLKWWGQPASRVAWSSKNRRRHKVSGWRYKECCTGPDKSRGSATHIYPCTWQPGHWRFTASPITVLDGGKVGKHPASSGPPTLLDIFPKIPEFVKWPVRVCKCQAKICINLWIHFVHCHVRDIVSIMEEVNHPHPRFPKWDMFVP